MHLNSWAEGLPQQRSLERTTALGVGLLCGVGKRTITRAIGFPDKTQKDWPADHKKCSRWPWEPRDLFAPILREAIHHYGVKRLIVSVDDTRVWRTGQHVPWTRRKMSKLQRRVGRVALRCRLRVKVARRAHLGRRGSP